MDTNHARKPLLLTLEYPPDRGGVAAYLAGEVESSGEPVRVVRAQEHFWDKWPAWLPLLWRIVPPLPRGEFPNSPPLPRACPEYSEGGGLRGGYVYLWFSHILPMGYVALWWKWRFKTPYRVYVHGLDLVRPSHSAWKRFWARRILKNADEIVANSNATRALLARYGIDPGVAHVSYPKIFPPLPEGGTKGGRERWREYYAEAGQALRKKYNLVNKPVLLTVSRLVKRKGIDLVIKSLPQVWQEIPDLTYIVVGDGEERGHLNVIASEAKQSRDGRIIFTGSVSDDEKYAWLSACDCFILTPIDDPNDFEGYGIVYKEAQMFAKPVIGSRVGGVPEAVGNDGVLVEPGSLEQITQAILKHVRA